MVGDALTTLAGIPDGVFNTVVTSPPYYGLRDYENDGQLGLESTPQEYVTKLVTLFREVRRVLRDDGTVWLNLGDSYAGSGKGGNPGNSPHLKQRTNHGSLSVRDVKRDDPLLKPKQILGIPWRVAFALQADGWWLRQDIIWHKPNPMPESSGSQSRCIKSHEYVFLLSKQPTYYFDYEAIEEPATGRSPGNKRHKHVEANEARVAEGDHRERTKLGLSEIEGRNMRRKRSVWTVATQGYKGAHFATFPPALIEPCILAGCPVGGWVLDPFGGAGTTGLVAERLGRNACLIEINPTYAEMAVQRINEAAT